MEKYNIAMETLLTFSQRRIADEILAESALRYQLRDDCPSVLTRDNIEALGRLIHASFSRICLRMMGCLSDCSCGCDSVPGADGDVLMSMTVEHEPTAVALTWVHALQHAVAMDVLAEALVAVDAAAAGRYAERCGALVEGVMRDVSMSGVKGVRLVPHYY